MSTSVRFELKTSQSNEKLIYLLFSYGNRIVVNGKVRYRPFKYSTGKSILPEYWDMENQRPTAKYKAKFGKDLSIHLDSIETEILNIFRKYEIDHIVPTLEQLRSDLDVKLNRVKPELKSDDIVSFIEDFIHTEKEKELNRKSDQTIEKYENFLKKLKSYENHLRKKLTFAELDEKLYNGFFKYVNKEFAKKNKVEISQNYLWEIQKWFRKFLNEAVKKKFVVNFDFTDSDEKIKFIEVDYPYFTIEELNAIINLNLSALPPSYELVRDLAVIMSLTALRYSDLYNLRLGKIEKGSTIDNQDFYFVTLASQKADKTIAIPVLAPVYSIYKKYKNTFPEPLTNQTFDLRIKEICQKAKFNSIIKINKNRGTSDTTEEYKKHEIVSAHTCRRSFISNMILQGVPEIVLKQISHPMRGKGVFESYNKISLVTNISLFFTYLYKNKNVSWLLDY